MDDYPSGRVGPLTKGGKDDTGWRGRQYFRPKVSGQGFPDKHFRTKSPEQVFPDKPAGSCTTHGESIISIMAGNGRRASLRVWDHEIPNPWRHNIIISWKQELQGIWRKNALSKMKSLRNQLEIINGLV